MQIMDYSVSGANFGLQEQKNDFLTPGTSRGEFQENVPEPRHKVLKACKCLLSRRLRNQPPYVVLRVFVGEVVCFS